MKRFVTFFCFLLIPGLTARSLCAGQFGFKSEFAGEPVYYKVSSDLLAKAPNWDQTSCNPPLCARDALRSAKKGLVRWLQLLDYEYPEGVEYVVDSLTLRPFGNDWGWVVRFRHSPLPGYGSSGIAEESELLVLMDESLVVPLKGASNQSLLHGLHGSDGEVSEEVDR